jgi:ketosteroid isomerase-like protein
MSQEDVEIVRRLVEAINARDLEWERYYAEFFDPQVEYRTSMEDPDAAIHRGRQAYRRYLEQWLESFDGLHIDVEEYIDVGDDRVFTWSRFTGRGRTSGVPADWYLAINFARQSQIFLPLSHCATGSSRRFARSRLSPGCG